MGSIHYKNSDKAYERMLNVDDHAALRQGLDTLDNKGR